MKRFGEIRWLVVAICLFIVGCSSRGGDMHISGKVTVEGELAESGTIIFTPQDGQTKVAGGVIENGRYQIEVPPGEKIVQIRVVRLESHEIRDSITGKTFQTEKPIRLTTKEYELPRSPLRASVTQSGEHFDFDLPRVEQEN